MHPPAYPAYSTFIRHCPFHYNILNNIKDHNTTPRNRNRGNRGNIKSRQRGPSRLRLCFLQPDLSLTEWLFLRASPRMLLNFHCLRVTISYQISYLKDPLRVLVESTSRVSPAHYPRWHPCKSQPAKSISQPANTKVTRQLPGQKGYGDHPAQAQVVSIENTCTTFELVMMNFLKNTTEQVLPTVGSRH
jgi:hypothetical protein